MPEQCRPSRMRQDVGFHYQQAVALQLPERCKPAISSRSPKKRVCDKDKNLPTSRPTSRTQSVEMQPMNMA